MNYFALVPKFFFLEVFGEHLDDRTNGKEFSKTNFLQVTFSRGKSYVILCYHRWVRKNSHVILIFYARSI